MNFWNNFKSALKGKNKICDPLLIYIILGIFKFIILYQIYSELTREGFAPYNNNYNNYNNNNIRIHKYELLTAITFMIYLYIIFGLFIQLLCKNNMKGAAWFIILYPFICKLVWTMII